MNAITHRLRATLATTLLTTSTLAAITAVVSAPAAHAVVTTGNEIVQFGSNTYGQTGTGDPLGTQWKAISAGTGFTLALKNDGTVWAWGANGIGQLGTNTTTNSSVPVQVVGPSGTGYLTGITTISAGAAYSLARMNNGTVWAWGANDSGQLGNNTNTYSSVPVQVVGPGGGGALTGITSISAGQYHSIARKSDGTVWAWGSNYNGQLGNNTTTGSSVPVEVVGPTA